MINAIKELALSSGSLFEESYNEWSIICKKNKLLEVLGFLKGNSETNFEQLIDLCAVDYSDFPASRNCIDRGRYSVVYHLLSITNNQRIRVVVFLNEDDALVDSVTSLWECANWYEREAYDLFGIVFDNHPDLRRLLTDYGFIGHPFRKDFPLSGHVEMRYDEVKERIVYEPVSIDPRVTVPRVIRKDS